MGDLLTIAPPTAAFPRSVLDAPGGFAWWYADSFDARKNGVVLIWSYGLPFLPGVAGAARRGEPVRPRERPSLNVAVYERGRLVCYLLQELEESDACWDGESWHFGNTLISLKTSGNERTLEADLDCPLPGGDCLRGSVSIEGVSRREGQEESDEGGAIHDWAPLVGPSRGRAELAVGRRRYLSEGRAYIDGNYGFTPLHETRIHAWTWGRVPIEDREVIFYVLWREGVRTPEATGVEIDDLGQLHAIPLEVEIVRRARGRSGLRYPADLLLSADGAPWLRTQAAEVVDDGPFYLRYFVSAERNRKTAVGLAEFCRTDRIDLSRHRPLVRMRVHRPHGDNSMWLPLFSGPREGRFRRMLTQLLRRAP